MIQFETKPAAANDQVVPTKHEPTTTEKKTVSVANIISACGNGEELSKEVKRDDICWATYD